MSELLAALKPESFEPLAGESFTLGAGQGTLELRLLDVKRSGAALREGGSFSLVFVSAPGPILPQGIYPVTHPAVGAMEVFVVPLGPVNGANQYEVIFT